MGNKNKNQTQELNKSTSTIENILKWGIYAVALVPLIVFSQYFSPFHFGKVIMLRGWIEILFVLYVFLILKDRKFIPKFSLILKSVSAFVALYFIASLTSVNIYQSMMGTLERMGGFFTLLHFWILLIMMVSVLRKREDWIMLIKISVMTSLISLAYGFLQKGPRYENILGSGSRLRMFGTLGNTAIFAGYHLVSMFFAFILAIDSSNENKAYNRLFYIISSIFYAFLIMRPVIQGPDSRLPNTVDPTFYVIIVSLVFLGLLYMSIAKPNYKNEKWFFNVVILLSLVAILSTAVRGAILGVFVSIFVFIILYSFTGIGNKSLRKWMIAVFLLLVILQGMLMMNKNSDFVKNNSYLSRLSDVSLSTRTLNTRFWAWSAGINGWNDSAKTVLLGWGPENFNIPFSVHFNPKFYQGPGSETMFDRAHNMFVEILVTTGIFGFLAYVSILCILFMYLFRMLKRSDDSKHRTILIVMISGLAGYIVHNFFFFDTSSNFILLFILIGFIYFLNGDNNINTEAQLKSPVSSVGRNSIAMLLAVAVVFSIYKNSIIPAKANYAGTRAITAFANGDFPAGVKKFKESLDYNAFDYYDMMNGQNRYAQSIINSIGEIQKSGVDARSLLLDIIERENSLIVSSDLDYLPYLYISRANLILGQSDPNSKFNKDALEASMKALKISPTFVRTYYEIAQAYINMKDTNKAIEWFQKAIDLEPDVAISWWYQGLALLEVDRDDDALSYIDKSIALGYDPVESELIRIIGLYAKKGDFIKVAELYEKIIKTNTSNAQYFASLMSAYVQIREIDKAVEVGRKAIKYIPEIEQQVRAYIESIGRTL